CVTGMTIRHVGERFQRSNGTISTYFKQMTVLFSSPPFYTRHVEFPTGEIIPREILRNPKFWPFFCNAIGAIDGSHIPIAPPSQIRANYRNRK
ncbi:hypothetical protein BJ138DRAFT_986109, partial [Hygrophoropsis aurantiaca]